MAEENTEQKEFWEGFAAIWVERQADMDALFTPVLQGTLDRAVLTPGARVMDIGCGTGTSTIEAARLVGPDGHTLGVDISDPMLVRARELARNVTNASFLTADVADHPFEDGGFDVVISRFGVMFFADPVKAFSNIRRALKPGGRLSMSCWSNLAANPWFSEAMYAAKSRLGTPPPVNPDDPGPLAFRDIDRVTGILDAAGFQDIAGNAVPVMLTPPGNAAHAARLAASIGPAARTMEYFNGTEADFDAIAADVAEAYASHENNGRVTVPAEINFFTARA